MQPWKILTWAVTDKQFKTNNICISRILRHLDANTLMVETQVYPRLRDVSRKFRGESSDTEAVSP
jgi:hypothetical protein